MKHLLIEDKHTEKDYLCVIKDGDEIFINSPLPVVDLGLPSGTKWATMNVGAETEYDSGLYFQWGDTQGYTAKQVGTDKTFYWSNYKYGTSSSNLTKYNSTDGKTKLEIEDDAAYVNMGKKFRMPTSEQIQELIDETNHEFVSDDNGKYMKFTNRNDSSKFIILPASGYADNGSFYDVGSYGLYWSSSLDTSFVDSGRLLGFDNNGNVYNSSDNRCCGCPVRGVLGQ